MRPGFKSRRRRHKWVEFVVGSLPCSERFFSGYSGFPLSSKTNISNFQIPIRPGINLQIVIYIFIYLSIKIQDSDANEISIGTSANGSLKTKLNHKPCKCPEKLTKMSAHGYVKIEGVWGLKRGFVTAAVSRADRLRECPSRELLL